MSQKSILKRPNTGIYKAMKTVTKKIKKQPERNISFGDVVDVYEVEPSSCPSGYYRPKTRVRGSKVSTA